MTEEQEAYREGFVSALFGLEKTIEQAWIQQRPALLYLHYLTGYKAGNVCKGSLIGVTRRNKVDELVTKYYKGYEG